MTIAIRVLLVLCLFATSAAAQTRSSWGAAVGFLPTWETGGQTKTLDELVFSDAYPGISGSEFRIGIARGRRLSGDWGVSFVRRTIEGVGSDAVSFGAGCQGGSSPGGPVILQCSDETEELTPENLLVTGLEVHKFIAFVTIGERVQVGLNVAGGFGQGKGQFASRQLRTTFKCTFPVGVFPNSGGNEDPCTGGTRSNEATVQTGTGVEPFTRILASERNFIPLGKVELAVAVIVAPQVKVRFSGGLAYPGMSSFGVTGVYFFSRN